MARHTRYVPLLLALAASPLVAQRGPVKPLSPIAKYAKMIRAVEDTSLDSLYSTNRKWPDDRLGTIVGIADSAATAYYRIASQFDDIANELEAHVPPASLAKVHDQFVGLVRQHAAVARMEYRFAVSCKIGAASCRDLDTQTEVLTAFGNVLIAKMEITRRIESMMVEAGAPPTPKRP